MLLIAVTMLVIVAAAGLLVAVTAFPHQGREVPGAPWLNDLLVRIADATGLEQPEDEVSRREPATSSSARESRE